MKAIEFLRALDKECLDLQKCGMTSFFKDDLQKISNFFRATPYDGKRELDKELFYYYADLDETFFALPKADALLKCIDADCFIYVWELEN